MLLIFFRHGPAVPAQTGHKDALRALTLSGKKKTRKASEGLKQFLSDQGFTLSEENMLIWSSPFVRAAETAALLSQAFRVPFQTKEFLANDELEPLIKAAAQLSHMQILILVGHQPILGNWSEALTGCNLPFKKAGAAGLQINQNQPTASQLRFFLQPSFLRRLKR